MKKIARALLSRALDAADAAFDAIASLRRVLLRGGFRPDARDYRSKRFARLGSPDVFVQTMAFNAADEGQAKRIVRLDAERYLPLAESAAAFDLLGPLPSGDKLRTRPEQDFLLGVVRLETLETRRREDEKRASIEAFVFEPPECPGEAFQFRDAAGDRRRRYRRGVTALALAAAAWTTWDLAGAWSAHLESAVARAESERMSAQRDVRRVERQLSQTRAALQSLSASGAEPLGVVNERLAILGRRLPMHTELRRVQWSSRRLTLAGVSYAPAEMELEIRRAFQGAEIDFQTTERGTPAGFTAVISGLSGASR